MKFGGTSTQDAAAMVNVARIVRAHLHRRPIVVISAIAKGTNALEEAGKLAAEGNAPQACDLLGVLVRRHEAIADELLHSTDRRMAIKGHLARSLAELQELVRGVAILRELTPRTLDAFYCYGELLSSRLIAAVLEEQGMKSSWLDTREFLVTDEHHTAALPLMNIVEDRLQKLVPPLLNADAIPVTQGFIGVTRSGARTTMGRESSDYSAAIIGCALNVEDIQIWTDVDGILTADPRVVRKPRTVKSLSFEEAFELSYFGAKVLHPNTMLPALDKNIPIHIYNSRRPDRSGSCVSSTVHQGKTVLKSVAFKRQVHIVSASPRKRLNQFIFWEHIHSALARHNAVASMTVTSDYNISMVLEKFDQAPALIREFEEVASLKHLPDQGIICVVGNNLVGSKHTTEAVFRATGGIGISLISFGASGASMSFVVDDDDVQATVRSIHKEFFESECDHDIFEELEDQSPVR